MQPSKHCLWNTKVSADFNLHPGFYLLRKDHSRTQGATELTDEHRAQVQNYLKATKFKLGLLVNFGHFPKLEIERIAGGTGRYG